MSATTQPLELDWCSTLAELRRQIAGTVRGWPAAVPTRAASREVRREMQRRGLPDRPSRWSAFVATGGWR